MDELRNRLINRGTETPHSLEDRITKAEHELTFARRFDTILINDDLNKATAELIAVVTKFTGC
jgi:guanylate kinase